MNHTFRVELTLENLKVIKLWHYLAQKDREATLADNQTITKIKAMAIAAQEERNAELRLFRRRRG
jgi:DNA-binding MltR family transcriptional regulator